MSPCTCSCYCGWGCMSVVCFEFSHLRCDRKINNTSFVELSSTNDKILLTGRRQKPRLRWNYFNAEFTFYLFSTAFVPSFEECVSWLEYKLQSHPRFFLSFLKGNLIVCGAAVIWEMFLSKQRSSFCLYLFVPPVLLNDHDFRFMPWNCCKKPISQQQQKQSSKKRSW